MRQSRGGKASKLKRMRAKLAPCPSSKRARIPVPHWELAHSLNFPLDADYFTSETEYSTDENEDVECLPFPANLSATEKQELRKQKLKYLEYLALYEEGNGDNDVPQKSPNDVNHNNSQNVEFDSESDSDECESQISSASTEHLEQETSEQEEADCRAPDKQVFLA